MESTQPRWINVLIPLFLVILAVVLYSNVINARFQYSWDDNRYVTENYLLRDVSAEGISRILTDDYWGAHLPVTILIYALQYQLVGLQPALYFVTNLLFHAANAVLVFFLLQRFTGNRAVAVIAAVLFVVHPVNVESVAWVAELKNVASLFFFLLAWLTHMQATEGKRSFLWLVCSWTLFLCAVFAKPVAVGAVILFALYDYWTMPRGLIRIVVRNIPYGLIGLLASYLLLLAHEEVGGIKTPLGSNLLENIALGLRIVWDYVASLVNPTHLNNMYIYTIADVLNQPLLILGGALILVGLLILMVWQPFGKPFCAFAVAWIVVTILPVSNIIPIAIQRADRYLYYPSVMFFMLVGMAAVLLWMRFRQQNQRYIMVAIAVTYVAILSVLTFQRVAVWHDTQSLWRDHLEDYPDGQSATGLLNLGVGYFTDNQLQEAFTTLQKLVQYYPENYKGNRLLGLTFYRGEDWANAAFYLKKALDLNGQPADIRDELGISYFQLGLQQFDLNEYANALVLYGEALPLVPRERAPIVLNNIGFTLIKLQRTDDAIQAFNAAVEIDPNYARAFINLGDVYLSQNDFTNARTNYEKALATGAKLEAKVLSDICLVKAELQDDQDETLSYCQQALDADPSNGLYLGRAAHVLLLYNDNARALQVAQRAIQIAPSSLAYRTLGDASARLGDTQAAIDAYREALKIDPTNRKAQEGLQAMGITP